MSTAILPHFSLRLVFSDFPFSISPLNETRLKFSRVWYSEVCNCVTEKEKYLTACFGVMEEKMLYYKPAVCNVGFMVMAHDLMNM